MIVGVHAEGGANDFWLDSVELYAPPESGR